MRADLRSSGRPAWRKAPTRLLRRPVLFAALAAASLLVALTVATFPLFLSAAQSELLTATLNDPSYTRYGAGITYRVNDVLYGAADPNGSSLLAERAGAFAKETARSPELDPAIESLAGTGLFVTGPDGKDPATGPVSGRLFFGDDDLAHVRVISGTEGHGVWLPDYIADPLHVGPGDRVMLHDGGDTVLVPIDGIYAAIFAAPRDAYWQPWSEDIYQFPSGCVDCPLPPPFILADRTQLLDLQAKLHDLRVDQALVAPVRATPPPTIEEVQTLGRFADALEGRMQTPYREPRIALRLLRAVPGEHIRVRPRRYDLSERDRGRRPGRGSARDGGARTGVRVADRRSRDRVRRDRGRGRVRLCLSSG